MMDPNSNRTSTSFGVLLRVEQHALPAVASCFTEAGFTAVETAARAVLSTGVTSRRSTGSSSAQAAKVHRCILVAVEREATAITVVHALAQAERVLDRPAARAELRRREEPVSDQERCSVPLALVGELPSQLAHARVADRQREMPVALHPADVQVLEHDHPLGSRELTRELMKHLLPLTVDPVVETRPTQLRALPVCGAALLARKLTVESAQ